MEPFVKAYYEGKLDLLINLIEIISCRDRLIYCSLVQDCNLIEIISCRVRLISCSLVQNYNFIEIISC